MSATATAATSSTAQAGGVVVAVGEGLRFVPVEVVTSVAKLSSFTEVPGARGNVCGIALVGDQVVTVLRVPGTSWGRTGRASARPSGQVGGTDSEAAILCRILDAHIALIALTGATILETGVFEACGSGVNWNGSRVELLDVRAIYDVSESELRATAASRKGPT